jgi:glycosyltransferase involved in cell wall biosynthesis
MLAPAVLAKMLGKGVIVVGGDYDIIYDPFARSKERLLRDRLRQILGSVIFRWIDWFITFSEYATLQAYRLPYIRRECVKQIYLGLPDLASGWSLPKMDTILTVGRVSHYDIFIKGLRTFVKTATLLPQYNFKLIGVWNDSSVDILRQWNNQNVAYMGFVTKTELLQTMSEAKVYVQASYREGFGMALAEAMLFECVPVVTKRGSLPEVVGDTGIYVPYDDPESTAAAVKDACDRRKELGPQARNRVRSLFPLEDRKSRLLQLVQSTYAQNKFRS